MNIKPVIIIPVYKSNLDDSELFSLNQLILTLGDFTIYFIKPHALSLKNYPENNIKVLSFEDKYFDSLKGYNELLTSLFFFKKFRHFTHMLIYQLDALVFKNELLIWCYKKFDYIGAPWFRGYSSGESTQDFIGVGNGGFSLRKINKSISILTRLKFAILLYKIKNKLNLLFRKNIKGLSYIQLKIYQFLNINYDSIYLEKLLNRNCFNEDGFWSIWIANSFKDFKIASLDEAIKFSFEVNPETLFLMNNSILPFGCHGWMKYDYKTFWVNHINFT
ncbi:MAG TPA: hypothetical protein DEB23_05905 [Chitinophagaceae bacterium]|nr:hypothetical protein [Chitinophagaceae bacterium]